jgi:uncharacterized Zn finger protein
MKPKEIKKLQARSRELSVHRVGYHTYVVHSGSGRFANHVVTLEVAADGAIHGRCTCPWAQNGGFGCSHVLATLMHLASGRGRTLSFWLDEEEARRQKRRVLQLAGDGLEGDIWITSRPGNRN